MKIPAAYEAAIKEAFLEWLACAEKNERTAGEEQIANIIKRLRSALQKVK